jgi:hypothetical protein
MAGSHIIDVRVTIDDEELARQFNDYVEREYKGYKGAKQIIFRRAIIQFLNREAQDRLVSLT